MNTATARNTRENPGPFLTQAEQNEQARASALWLFIFPAWIAAAVFLVLAFIVGRITRSSFLTKICLFPGMLIVTNAGLALILLPTRFVYIAMTGQRHAEWFEWVGDMTLIRQLFAPWLYKFWSMLLNVPIGPEIFNPVINTNMGLIIITQVLLWFFFGRGLSRDIARAIV